MTRLKAISAAFFLLAVNLAFCQSRSLSWELVGPEGGQIHSIYYDAQDSVLFAGTGTAGLFEASERNYRWSKLGYNDLVRWTGRGSYIVDIKKYGRNMYVCSDGGLFVSENSGENWRLIFGSYNGFATSIISFPSEANVIYLSFYGGGSGYFSNPGIHKSIDIWRHLVQYK